MGATVSLLFAVSLWQPGPRVSPLTWKVLARGDPGAVEPSCPLPRGIQDRVGPRPWEEALRELGVNPSCLRGLQRCGFSEDIGDPKAPVAPRGPCFCPPPPSLLWLPGITFPNTLAASSTWPQTLFPRNPEGRTDGRTEGQPLPPRGGGFSPLLASPPDPKATWLAVHREEGLRAKLSFLSSWRVAPRR